MGILYLKAFIFVLKVFAIQLSTINKIKVEVFIAFQADKCVLVRNIINLKGFKCCYQVYYIYIKACLYFKNYIIMSLLKKVKVY